jgi:hypothetical protein
MKIPAPMAAAMPSANPARGSTPRRWKRLALSLDMRCAFAALLAVSVAGCASVPVAPAPVLQRQAQALDARRLDDPGLAAAEAQLHLPNTADAAWTPDRLTVAAWYFDPRLAQAPRARRRMRRLPPSAPTLPCS